MSITRQIFKHSVVYSFATILGKLISLLMLPFYAYIFQTEGYGVIAVIDAAFGCLGILFAAGFHTAIVRIYHETAIPEKEYVLATGVLLVWALGLSVLPMLLLFARPVSLFLLGTPEYYQLIRLASLTLVVGFAGQSSATLLIIQQRSILYSALSILQLIVGLSLNIILVIVLRIGIAGIFLSSLACAFINCALVHFSVFYRTGLTFQPRIAKRLISFQAPLIPGEFVGYLSRQSERFLVRFMINLQGVGILEMGYKFAPLLNLFITFPFLQAWRTKNIELGESLETRVLASRMFTRYIFLMLFAGLLLAINVEDLLTILTPQSFWRAARIARLEIITTLFAGATAWLVFGLVYHKKTAKIAFIKSTCAILKVALSVTFIYFAGLTGAAYSALVTEILILLWIGSASQRVYRIPFEYRKLALMSGAALLLGLTLGPIPPSRMPFVEFLNTRTGSKVLSALQSTPLADWHDGKLISLFITRQIYVLSILVKSVIAFSYLALVAVVEPHLFNLLHVTSRIQSLFRTATSHIWIG